MEDLAGEKEMSEQLKFENLLPEETPEIVPALPGEFQPRKVEEVIPDKNIPEDTYLIYPTGGHHLFYEVPNALPRYQLPIWPYVKRIKFEQRKDGSLYGRGRSLNLSQINCDNRNGYPRISFSFRKPSKNWWTWSTSMHRLVALAWIPNPEKKKNVCHINDDSTNYFIKNLKWGTHKENNKGKIVKRPDSMADKYQDLVKKGIIKG